ncbi:MAG: alpha/beta fold hydrolase, partial [Candidatus Margulisbacteria bacterium]|nr:alpha/beta fold hydrolase [Candidatus Margulisiibacteriota bacterium]
MRIILIFLFSILFVSGQIAADSALTLSQLWDIPLDQVEYKIARSYQKGTIKVEEVYYQSRSFKGKPVRIFGYFCYPAKAKGKLPTILISHGGGGLAELGNTINWAKYGYAVLSIDLPGHGEKRARSRSTGPDMDVSVLLRTKPDPTYNYLIHSVAAVRNGITFLTQRDMVDTDRIGMVGLSWGGVNAILTNGQDKRLKTAVNVFGAGYIPEGCTWQERFNIMSADELGAWNQYIDPKNFLKTQ